MDSKEFKNMFDESAKKHNFEKAFGGWFKESTDCIAVLELQKSNFGNFYELNVKIFVQGMFGNMYTKSKDLVRKYPGDVFTRQPDVYKNIFDFDSHIDDNIRRNKLENLFEEFIVPLINKCLSRAGLRELAKNETLFILPAVKIQL